MYYLLLNEKTFYPEIGCINSYFELVNIPSVLRTVERDLEIEVDKIVKVMEREKLYQ